MNTWPRTVANDIVDAIEKGRNNSRIKLNYERMRESYCCAVQTTWVDYCKAYKEWLNSIWYNEKGEICMLYTTEAKEKAEKAEAAHLKALKDLNDFDTWVRVEKQLKGEKI